MRGQPTERSGRERGGGGLGGELNPEEGFLTGIELERVETLLRERSAEMTRTRASTQLHPSLDGVVFDRPVRPEPSPVLEVTLTGACVDCGDRISSARLKALPDATRCVSCQRQLESLAE
jgi:hypothetical protein